MRMLPTQDQPYGLTIEDDAATLPPVTANAPPPPLTTSTVVASSSTTTSHILPATGAVEAGTAQSIPLASLFSITAAPTNPSYLVLSVLDRNEYTLGYKTSAMGHLAGNGHTDALTNVTADAWSAGIVFTYQASTGTYSNAIFGALSTLTFTTGTNIGDTATISLYGTSNASLANSYAANPYVLLENPTYFTNQGSVAIVTNPTPAAPPSQATPHSITAAALSFVGATWNLDGCWVLASDIAAKAGTTLPASSPLVGVPGIANGAWFVAYNGPTAGSAGWLTNLAAGEIVSFVTTAGGGHITTVVSGSGGTAQLVDNITYGGPGGTILNSANDGDPNDVIVAAPHAASQEFTGVNAATVVVYRLDTPVITAGSLTTSIGAAIALAADITATDPRPGQTITEYQLYETNSADHLTQAGITLTSATSAAGAITTASLATIDLIALSAGADSIEARAYNGSYWGDWSALSVTIAAPLTVAQALATLSGTLAIADSPGAISANAGPLQAIAAAGRITALALTTADRVSFTATQLSTDAALVKLLPSASIAISGATIAQAAALQANAQVASFSITDSTADMVGTAAALAKDTKLAAITLTGTTGGKALNLTGLAIPINLNLTGNTASVSAGLTAATPTFLGAPDIIALGSARTLIVTPLTAAGGIDEITNFTYGIDQLTLTGATSSTLKAYNETIGGQNAIAITGTSTTHGVILLDQPSGLTASAFLASHVSFANGNASIS